MDSGLPSQFFDSYRTAFETLDPDVISEYFAYPCHVTSDGDKPDLTVARTREEWSDTIAQLVTLYRDVGVTSGTALSISESPRSERVVQAGVHWGVLDGDGNQLYEFHALYTLVDEGEGFKIAALAHDELPQLLALMSASAS